MHRLLGGLADLRKARDQGVVLVLPSGVLGQQDPVAVGHGHDDRRADLREDHVAAVRAGQHAQLAVVAGGMSAAPAELVVPVPHVQVPGGHLRVHGVFRVEPAVGAHVVVGKALGKGRVRRKLRQEVGRFIDGEQVHAALDGTLHLFPVRQQDLIFPQGDENAPLAEGADLCAGADGLGVILVVQVAGCDFL